MLLHISELRDPILIILNKLDNSEDDWLHIKHFLDLVVEYQSYRHFI